jgi:hypothetical protein
MFSSNTSSTTMGTLVHFKALDMKLVLYSTGIFNPKVATVRMNFDIAPITGMVIVNPST